MLLLYLQARTNEEEVPIRSRIAVNNVSLVVPKVCTRIGRVGAAAGSGESAIVFCPQTPSALRT